MPNVMIVTHCKGRLHQLQQTLPLVMKQKLPNDYFIGGVVVVDYGCPDDTVGWVFRNVEPATNQIVSVAVAQDVTNPYDICRARNIGCLEAFSRHDADLVFLTDCDIMMHSEDCIAAYVHEFEKIKDELGSGIVGTGTRVWDEDKQEEVDGWISACLIERDAFFELRGYDESHVGYGHDDTHFFLRAKYLGVSFSTTPLSYEHLWCEEKLRDMFMGQPPSREEHIKANHDWHQDMERPVNPNGFGEYKGFFITKEPR